MKVTLYTRNDTPEYNEGLQALRNALQDGGITIIDNWNPPQPVDIVISVGGDGTLLSAVHKIGKCGIPVLGINFGHLGFLTTAGRDDIQLLVDCLINKHYSVEKRSILQVNTDNQTLYALNEVYLHRVEHSPLLHTQVEVDNFQVATYSADGLIVATPTGSTAYSLSCGGPILAPGSGSLVITPIAAHTLTLRPLVVSDNSHIRLRNYEPDALCTLGADSFVTTISGPQTVLVSKADYDVSIIRLANQNFYTAIRNKLMWGR